MKPKSYLNSEHINQDTYIPLRIQEYFESYQISTSNPFGRPRHAIIQPRNEDAIKEWYDKLFTTINPMILAHANKNKKEGRVDVIFAAIYRSFGAIPWLFKDLYTPKAKYKSGEVKDSLDSYLECFFKGLVNDFEYQFPKELDSEQMKVLVDLFKSFTKIRFPKDRIKLLEKMAEVDSVKKGIDINVDSIDLARGISIKEVKKMFQPNSYLAFIWNNIRKFSPHINNTDFEHLQKYFFNKLKLV